MDVYGTAGPIDAYDFHGKTDPQIARELLTSGEVAGETLADRLHEVWASYLPRLAERLREADIRLLPGIRTLVERLHGAPNAVLGLLTGNLAEGARLKLTAAGLATGEKVWRMPLDKAYDKLIDSKNADMKNIGGRYGGAITGAQFIQRFVKKDTPWAHLDVAGTAMDSSRNDINQSWGSGWGVRLLDRLVAENYEKAEK